ncbi:MAG TPA: hypothetical protein VF126_07360 [Acidobacteriaceae bacterium]
MPRREEWERKARQQAAVQPALDCEACGALTSGSAFRYFSDRVICAACERQNPQSRVRNVPREALAPREIMVNFIQRNELRVQATAADGRTSLSPFIPIASGATLRRLLAYLGATPQQLGDFDHAFRVWGHGTTQIALLPGRRNLLRLRE